MVYEFHDVSRVISEKSVSYQKKDGRGNARPSFFWYDNDKDLLKVCFLVTRIIMCFTLAYQKILCMMGQKVLAQINQISYFGILICD